MCEINKAHVCPIAGAGRRKPSNQSSVGVIASSSQVQWQKTLPSLGRSDQRLTS